MKNNTKRFACGIVLGFLIGSTHGYGASSERGSSYFASEFELQVASELLLEHGVSPGLVEAFLNAQLSQEQSEALLDLASELAEQAGVGQEEFEVSFCGGTNNMKLESKVAFNCGGII